MNAIIWMVWILTTQLLLLQKTIATPLVNFAGNKMGKREIQTHGDVQFFDDDDSNLFDPSEDVNSCARGTTFCEQIDNYPSTKVTSILSEENKFAEIFGSDLVNAISIGNRFGVDEEDEEVQLCSSTIRLVYPQAGITRDNTWRYIINQSKSTQGVRVEECDHNRECDMMHHLPFGFRSQCKQKFVYRQLVAIDEEDNTIKDLFKIPACWQCVLIRSPRKRGF